MAELAAAAEAIQKKTFTKWMNAFLKVRGMKVEDIWVDLADGTALIALLEIMGKESLPVVMGRKAYPVGYKFAINHRMENLNMAIDYVKSKGITLVNVGAGDLERGSHNIVLGFIFKLILDFSVQELDGTKGLLLWCQRSTEKFVNDGTLNRITNFKSSWTDGLAFCAIIARYRPDLIDFNSLSRSDARGNL